MQLVHDIVKACKEHHNAAARKERLAAVKGVHTEQRLYATVCTAASVESQQQQQQVKARSSCGGSANAAISSSCNPRPLPQRVRVVCGSQQIKAAAAAVAATVDPAERCREKSESGNQTSITPTSILATAAEAATGKLLLAAASPVEQPRCLPPSLLPALLPHQQAQEQAQQQVQAQQHTQQQQHGLQPQASSLAAVQQFSAQQLQPPGGPTPRLGAWQQEQQQHMQGSLQGHPQGQQLMHYQRSQQQLVQQPGCGRGDGTDQQMRWLVEELRLRLGMAEKAAAASR